MPYAHIIARAWKIAADNPKLKWFIWFPSFMAVLIFTAKIGWQSFAYATELGLVNTSLDFNSITNLFEFITQNNLWGWTFIGFILLLLFYFIIPAWIDGILILILKQRLEDPEKILSIPQKIIQGNPYFFKVFELHGALALFSPLSVLFFGSFIFRSFDGGIEDLIMPLVFVYFIVATIVNMFTSFAEYYLVCDDEGVASSIKKSAALVFMNLKQTMTIMILLALINVRILINIFVVFGVPVAIFTAITVFGDSAIIIISIIFGILAIALAAYISALIEIFTRSVWIQTFANCKARLKEFES